MLDHSYFANLIWQIADLLRGPYRPPQYERVMLPMTVLRRFDCVLAPTKAKVLAGHAPRRGDGSMTTPTSIPTNHSLLHFEGLKADPDHMSRRRA